MQRRSCGSRKSACAVPHMHKRGPRHAFSGDGSAGGGNAAEGLWCHSQRSDAVALLTHAHAVQGRAWLMCKERPVGCQRRMTQRETASLSLACVCFLPSLCPLLARACVPCVIGPLFGRETPPPWVRRGHAHVLAVQGRVAQSIRRPCGTRGCKRHNARDVSETCLCSRPPLSLLAARPRLLSVWRRPFVRTREAAAVGAPGGARRALLLTWPRRRRHHGSVRPASLSRCDRPGWTVKTSARKIASLPSLQSFLYSPKLDVEHCTCPCYQRHLLSASCRYIF